MTDTLELRYVPLDTLRRWDRNAKRHDLGALAESITRHGFRDPPAYDPALNNGEGGIVEGNGRGDALSAMQAQGQPAPRGVRVEGATWLVPVLFGVDAPSQAAAEAYGVAHNNLTMAGGDFTALDVAGLWEPAGYAALLESLAQQGEIPVGMDGEDVDAVLRELAGGPALPPDEPVTVDDGPTRCQPGDVWRVGRHLVACLDSTDAEAVRRLVAGRKVGMVWADPPYGMNLDVDFDGMFSNDASHRKTGKRFEPVKGDDSDYDPRPLMEAFAHVKEQFWWGADYYADKIPGITDGVFIVWDKRCSEEMDKVVGNVFELAWSKQKHRKEIARILWSGHHGMQGDTKERVHPTQKPVRLVEWFFDRYSAPDDLILDPFLGSGPSLKAAEAMGRTVVGFELAPAYVDHILAWGEAEGLSVERVPDA